MIAYVDSSVLLRIVMGQPGRLQLWPEIDQAVSSELLRTECLRAIDRARVLNRLDERVTAQRRAGVLELLDAFTVLPLDRGILERAADPFPTSIATLDAIHLASAMLVREELPSMVFATHDSTLGLAAAAVGFEVHGLDGS